MKNKISKIDELTQDNVKEYLGLVDEIYPRDQFEEMNDSSRWTIQYGNGLSTMLKINDEYVGFCVSTIASMNDVTEEMVGILSPDQEQMMFQAVKNKEVAYIADFEIKKEVSSGFLLVKYMKEIAKLFKSSGIKYVVSNFRESSSMKLLDLLINSNQAREFLSSEVVFKQEDDDVLELDDEKFPFGIIQLNTNLINIWKKIGKC